MSPPFVVNGVRVIEPYPIQAHLCFKPPQMMPVPAYHNVIDGIGQQRVANEAI